MFRLRKKGSVKFIESDLLSECAFLKHAFCTRHEGVSEGKFSSLNFSVREGDRIEHVRRNWEIVAEAFGLRKDNFLVVSQVHGDNILIVNEPVCSPEKYAIAEYDAIVTNQLHIAITVKTADCVPILFFDRVKRVIGIAHAGWRGTSLNIAGKVVMVLKEVFSSCVDDILVAIGPSIGPCCYQVDEKVFKAMGSEVRAKTFFHCSIPGHWMLDLPTLNKMQIIEQGVHSINVHRVEYCTSCHRDIFFSYRGEKGVTGRQINFIMMTDDKGW